ncbi:hypothetical protein GCM10010303_44060 [Streptomyces purpurascens]|nr:hypothetical protein GCM10010303_44060 [Streptomyces purpurascens]
MLGVVESQGAGEGVEHGGAGAGLLAAFQTDVVVDAHPGERRQLLTAQAGGATQTGTDREADLLGEGLGATGAQELPQLPAALLGCHTASVTPP